MPVFNRVLPPHKENPDWRANGTAPPVREIRHKSRSRLPGGTWWLRDCYVLKVPPASRSRLPRRRDLATRAGCSRADPRCGEARLRTGLGGSRSCATRSPARQAGPTPLLYAPKSRPAGGTYSRDLLSKPAFAALPGHCGRQVRIARTLGKTRPRSGKWEGYNLYARRSLTFCHEEKRPIR